MNKIIFLFDSTYGDSYFRGFANELVRWGNQVLYINLYNLDFENIKLIKKEICSFGANVLFSFNFSKIKNLADVLPQKKVIFDIDTPENIIDRDFFINEYNTNKEMYYTSIQSDYIDILKNTMPEITDYSRCFYLPPATSFQNTKRLKKRNIFFCSTNWDYNLFFNMINLNKKSIVNYHNALKENYFSPLNKFFDKKIKIDQFLLKWNIAGLERVAQLSLLADLGLEIYGDRWDKLFYNLDVMSCLKYRKISNSADCERYYNESKISVNFSHLQAKKAFSFRVMDIMATGSCLLMEDKEDWHSLFDKYLSQETISSIVYKDKYDMREKAKKLLNNEELRQKCVNELNYAINQNGRWLHRITDLGKLINVNLKKKQVKGCLIEFTKKYDYKTNNNKEKWSNFLFKLQILKRFKLIVYLFCLILAQIPIFDLLQRRKRRDKLRQKIDKYWR